MDDRIQADTMKETFPDALKDKGFVQSEDGSWHKPRRNLAGLGQPERERNPVQALDGSHAPRQSRKARMAVCIEIISFRKRLLDSDNNVSGNKPLRDAVAKSLGLDDGDPMLRWEYSQVRTAGRPGTLVKITV